MTDHVYWKEGTLYVLDQRALPFKKRYIACRTARDAVRVVKNMAVRGAPLIGIVAAYGFVLGVQELLDAGKDVSGAEISRLARRINTARPTAVNLSWALKRMAEACGKVLGQGRDDLVDAVLDEAISIHVEDIENNRMLSLYGAELVDDGDTLLTHCNAGALATGGYGTALGVIRAAHESGKKIKVIATETRPYFQGARLTAWELHNEGINVELVPDNHVGFLFDNRMADKVIVGADRIARNGDTANKIGTYMIALCAHHYGLPFYVAAPVSTFDASIPNGAYIEIEERDGWEVKHFRRLPVTVDEVKARYFAFDVTPGRYISSFITEKGIVAKPFGKYIKMLF